MGPWWAGAPHIESLSYPAVFDSIMYLKMIEKKKEKDVDI